MSEQKSQNKKQYSSRLEEVWDSKTRINAKELTTIIDVAYKSRSRWTICIVGESGIGKSMIPETYAKNNGLGFINLKGSGLLPEDIRGFGTVNKCISKDVIRGAGIDEKMGSAIVEYLSSPATYSFHLIPQLAQAFEPGFKGILFLDEFAQSSKEVQDVYFQLIYDRRIDEKVLSEDVIVMTAMNPPGVEEYNLNPLTKAAEDRLEFYVYEPTYVEWCNWASEYGIIPELIDFVRNTPSCFKENKGRRLHNLSDRISDLRNNEITSTRIIAAAANACLGYGHAPAFIKYMNGISITPSDILGFNDSIEETIKKVKDMPDDKRVGVLYSINKELLDILENREECIRIVSQAVNTVNEKEASIKVSRSTKKNISSCVSLRKNLNASSSDEEITAFIANVLMCYSIELYESNADVIVSFVRDVSTRAWPNLIASMNGIMRQPEFSTLVSEVLRCQGIKTKKAE